MQKNLLSDVEVKADWYSEEFIYNSVVNYLKENGYKVYKDFFQKETIRSERVITASRFFKKEVIEVKGYPYHYYSATRESLPVKNIQAKSWFTEALFNSLVNFSLSDNGEVAMAFPNVSRYQAIVKKLNDYFSMNDLYFRIYLVNEDGSVEVSNLNIKYSKTGL